MACPGVGWTSTPRGAESEQRRAIEMAYYRGLCHREIADGLGSRWGP